MSAFVNNHRNWWEDGMHKKALNCWRDKRTKDKEVSLFCSSKNGMSMWNAERLCTDDRSKKANKGLFQPTIELLIILIAYIQKQKMKKTDV